MESTQPGSVAIEERRTAATEAQLQHPGIPIWIGRCGTRVQLFKGCVVKTIEGLKAGRLKGWRPGEVIGTTAETLKIESRQQRLGAQHRKR